MSELRHDALSGQDVIVAAGRAARPTTFAVPTVTESAGECAFCPGSERMTPPEVVRDGEGGPDLPGWDVRVFPNLYPILGGPDAGPGTTGAHEVVVLTPDHRSLGQLDDDEATRAVTMWRDRVRAHLAARHAYSVAIVNHLPGAGASMAHAHAQLFALDFVPPMVDAALERARAAARDLVAADVDAAGPPISTDPVWVWCPHASTSPYLVRIAHPEAGPRFDESDDTVIADVAVALRDALARVAAVLGDVPYNLVVRTAPPGREPYHWYVDLIPRVSIIGGFEQATGVLVNTVTPEAASGALRDALT
jgi:UDPglucose--hexose-1-phosphate uridylyltransferase